MLGDGTRALRLHNDFIDRAVYELSCSVIGLSRPTRHLYIHWSPHIPTATLPLAISGVPTVPRL